MIGGLAINRATSAIFERPASSWIGGHWSIRKRAFVDFGNGLLRIWISSKRAKWSDAQVLTLAWRMR